MAEGVTLGSLPADSEQFMLIEHMAGQVEKMMSDIEKLKDKQRTFANGTPR